MLDANHDPLLGCRLKLQAAWRHRQALGAALEDYSARDDPGPEPLHLGVIVGDFLHNLRCVLDHLVWRLVELNGREPTSHNQFPIFDERDDYGRKAGRYLRGVSPIPRALIETFQPYHLDEPNYHSLAVLRDLSNIDKHRFVHPVVVVGHGDDREVRFTDLEVTANALFRLEQYVTYSLFTRFEKLFPLPPHAVDNVVSNAVHDAVESGIDLSRRRPEAALVEAVAEAVLFRTRRAAVAREQRYRELRGWTRPPGGVDVVVSGLVNGPVLMEMKVGKPGEAIWDAIKLCDILAAEGKGLGYLVYAGTQRTWSDDAEGSRLFQGTRTWRTGELIAEWPRAWGSLLIGGRGIRPSRSVGAIEVTNVCWINVAGSSYSVKVVRVSPVSEAPPQHFDPDGWPVGVSVPVGLRSRVRKALRVSLRGAEATTPDRDPCHGYPWYSRWTQRRLDEVVKSLADDGAYRCLRSRLGAERGWTEDDLRQRLDLLRRSGDAV